MAACGDLRLVSRLREGTNKAHRGALYVIAAQSRTARPRSLLQETRAWQGGKVRLPVNEREATLSLLAEEGWLEARPIATASGCLVHYGSAACSCGLPTGLAASDACTLG